MMYVTNRLRFSPFFLVPFSSAFFSFCLFAYTRWRQFLVAASGAGVLRWRCRPHRWVRRECLSLPCHVPGGRKFFLAEQRTALPEGSGTYCSAGGARSAAFRVISALTAKIHHRGPRCQRAAGAERGTAACERQARPSWIGLTQ